MAGARLRDQATTQPGAEGQCAGVWPRACARRRFVKDTDSLGKQIQRAFRQARVVKTLNTLDADLQVHPASLGAESSVFLSGHDVVGEATVADLLESFGHTHVIDLGDISTARGAEMLLPVWLRLMGALGTEAF